ncbi:DNA-methyltransferase [Lysinibacillus sphaericus]|uniref:DNA-methyltransferase n=1 Tax=Lysinibacillus sphaericus TaxID=1421 RepID=UPI001CBF3705|nr:DNA methyltransferase [Lysinibacillus sphaericus]
MKHLAENHELFSINKIEIMTPTDLPEINSNAVLIFDLSKTTKSSKEIFNTLCSYIIDAPQKTIFNFIGKHEIIAELAYLLEKGSNVHYQYLITLRKKLSADTSILPTETLLLLTVSKEEKIKVNRVLLPYTYCPECEKTTKDYGGKKHTFHQFGTTMSDVWKDIFFDEEESIFTAQNMIIVERIALMFSKRENEIIVFDLSKFAWTNNNEIKISYPTLINLEGNNEIELKLHENEIIQGNSLEVLKTLPSNSIDYVFIDPPYNLEKKYSSYGDDMDIENYFTWCDEWIEESLRVLKEGAFLSILNIPQWCIRHFVYLIQRADFDSWITWDSLSKPAGSVMPANYTILNFSKRKTNSNRKKINLNTTAKYMQPLKDGYCLRASCIKKRSEVKTKSLSDLWTDIHRIKHNSLRYDHPCQLPPDLMKRIIEVYSNPDDLVLDFFNGVGTTTLAADLIERKYLGFDLDPKYVDVAKQRHQMIKDGLDPFGKNNIDDENKTKNNTLKRVSKRRPEHKHINKKEVQLKMKELSVKIGRKPTIEDALEYFPEIPKEFYELYFKSWSEVIIATKVEGVNENKHPGDKGNKSKKRTEQQSFEL